MFTEIPRFPYPYTCTTCNEPLDAEFDVLILPLEELYYAVANQRNENGHRPADQASPNDGNPVPYTIRTRRRASWRATHPSCMSLHHLARGFVVPVYTVEINDIATCEGLWRVTIELQDKHWLQYTNWMIDIVARHFLA